MACAALTLTMVLVLVGGSLASQADDQEKKLAVSTTTEATTTLHQNDEKDKMLGDQPAAQHYVRPSGGSDKSRYTIRTLIPGQHYMLTAVAPPHQTTTNQKPAMPVQNYLPAKPDFGKLIKDYPWCSNPYHCVDGGTICSTDRCLQGSYCCRTNAGICCHQTNAGGQRYEVKYPTPNTDRQPHKAVDYSIKVTPKPVYAYTHPTPAPEEADMAPSPFGAPSPSVQYNTYENSLPSAQYPESDTGRSALTLNPQGIPPRSPYQPEANRGASEQPDNALIHPVFGFIEVTSEDDEAEEVLNQIMGTGVGAAPFVPTAYRPEPVQTPVYPPRPVYVPPPVYTPAPTYATQNLLQSYAQSVAQAPIPPFPSKRYPRSHYTQYHPYASLQQISYPPQVYYQRQPAFLFNVHSKREVAEPYANVQQVYYPSQYFYPPAYRSGVHVKREVPDHNTEQIYYPSQVFHPYAYRNKRRTPTVIPDAYYTDAYYSHTPSYGRTFWETSVY